LEQVVLNVNNKIMIMWTADCVKETD